MTKEDITKKYEPLIQEATVVFEGAKAKLDAVIAERDAKIAQIEDYQRALEAKAEAEAILAKGLPK